jgi:hypothetical protein
MKLEIAEYEFKTESDAQEAWQELDRIGRQRNQQNTVAFREGKRVYLRPEFISQQLMYELGSLAQAF